MSDSQLSSDPVRLAKTCVVLAVVGAILSPYFSHGHPVLAFVTATIAFCAIVLLAFNAIRRVRFSLRSMLLVMLWGGASGTLLTKLDHPALFALGIVGMLLLIAFLIASVARANIPKEKLDA